MKWFIIYLSAFVIEICSTFYITYVAEHNTIGMIIFAAIGPFLGLPFTGYMIDSKTWRERILMSFILSLGYVSGSIVVILLK